MQELGSVDFSLFGEAALQPGLLHRNSRWVPTPQILELLVHKGLVDKKGFFLSYVWFDIFAHYNLDNSV